MLEMRVADRAIGRIATAPFEIRHWRALLGILRTFDSPAAAFLRYISNRGVYPWRVLLRTPMGPVLVTLWDRHDLLTVNEVFCRLDYGSGAARTVVDIGGNRGFASLFFLTRDPQTRVWIYEPDAANVARLRETLSGFEGRYRLVEAAVTAREISHVRFVPQGRYGHIARSNEPGVQVPAVPIKRVVRDVARDVGSIDLLKIDTEGTERELVAAVAHDSPIREIRYDGEGGVVVLRRPRAQ
jgi:FkbM family methyltransferase